jgi:hypothetical protein
MAIIAYEDGTPDIIWQGEDFTQAARAFNDFECMGVEWINTHNGAVLRSSLAWEW